MGFYALNPRSQLWNVRNSAIFLKKSLSLYTQLYTCQIIFVKIRFLNFSIDPHSDMVIV